MADSFSDRCAAGQILGAMLGDYAHRPDVLVLGLPRGGVPVAYEVAKQLGVPLDVFLVRKLGVPGQEELAMGAIASGGVRVVNEDVVRALDISDEVIDEAAEREQQEMSRRELLYRDGRPLRDLRGMTVIVVDDGLATGSTMRAAVAALRRTGAAKIVVAVPVAAAVTCQQLRQEADEFVCVMAPRHFRAVGAWYENFQQVGDEEVRDLLKQAGS